MDSSFTDIVPADMLSKVSRQIPNYHSYISLLAEVRKDIFNDLNALDQNNISLCHTNLKKSRILIRNSFVKFINFHYSSFLDPFFDIAFFLLNTGLGNYQTIEENFLREYLNFHENMDMSLESSLEKLDKYKNSGNIIENISLKSPLSFIFKIFFIFKILSNSTKIRSLEILFIIRN